jgi:hypothetical protein
MVRERLRWIAMGSAFLCSVLLWAGSTLAQDSNAQEHSSRNHARCLRPEHV